MRRFAIVRNEEKVLSVPTSSVKPCEESQMRNGVQDPATENTIMVPEGKTIVDAVLALQLQLFRRRRISVADIDKATSPTAHHKADITELAVTHLETALS